MSNTTTITYQITQATYTDEHRAAEVAHQAKLSPYQVTHNGCDVLIGLAGVKTACIVAWIATNFPTGLKHVSVEILS